MVHPLDPLTGAELKEAVAIIRSGLAKHGAVYFKAVDLSPPPKKVLAPWLDDVAAGKTVAALPRMVRPLLASQSPPLTSFVQVEALVMLRDGPKAVYYEVFASLETKSIDRYFTIPAGTHVGVDEDEMVGLEVNGSACDCLVARSC